MKNFYFALGIFCLAGCASNSVDQVQPAATAQQATPKPIAQSSQGSKSSEKSFKVSYDAKLARKCEIVQTDDLSLKAMDKPLSSYSTEEISALPMNDRKVYRIVVPANIKTKEIRASVEKILSNAIDEDGDLDEINFLLYSDKKLASGAYDVATATWAPKGEWGNITPEIARSNDRSSYKTVVNVRPDLEKYLREKNTVETKFGLSDDKRKELYKEASSIGERAQAEADEMYPTEGVQPNLVENAGNNNQMRDDLTDKYQAQFRAKHKLSKKQTSEIMNEGFEKNWPFE